MPTQFCSVLASGRCTIMVLHVRDEAVDRLARELARKRGISITDAVREALEEAMRGGRTKPSIWDRTADLRAKVASFPMTGSVADKAFYDSLYDEEGVGGRR